MHQFQCKTAHKNTPKYHQNTSICCQILTFAPTTVVRALDDLLKIVVAGLEESFNAANNRQIVARPRNDWLKIVVAGLGGKLVRAKYVHQIAGQSGQPKTARATAAGAA
jgi:hypothetical protein